MTPKEIATSIIEESKPAIFREIFPEEKYVQLGKAYLDLLTKQEGRVLVPEGIVDHLLEAYNGGNVKAASLYQSIIALDKAMINNRGE